MIPLHRRALTALMLLSLSGCKPDVRFDAAAREQAPHAVAARSAEGGTGQPSSIVRGEAHLFRRDQPVTTVHPASQILRIYSYDAQGRKRTYAQGKDWWAADGTIRRTTTSAIPDFATYRYSV